MTLYAIIGYFDGLTENNIVKLWEELREKEITDYPFRRKGHCPHLTFSSFTELSPGLSQKIERLRISTKPLPYVLDYLAAL